MTINELNTNLTIALRGPLSYEFRAMLGMATIIFIASVIYLTYLIGFTHGQASAIDTFTITGGGDFLITSRIGITIGLFICAAGLVFRRLSGVIASMFGVIWLLLVYIWWRHESVAFWRNLEVADYRNLPDISPLAGLQGATWWDLFVLAIGIILFLWQAITLIRVIRAPGGWFSSGVPGRH